MQISVHLLETLYSESKFWLGLVGFLWAVFNGVSWIKSIKTNDLHHIQMGVNEIKDALTDQTKSIVGELKELRQDVRTSMMVGTRT